MDQYNILIVDDEVNNLSALERTFRREYNVFSALNGEDALAIMEQNDIALIIADHRMPGMDGVEFLEKILQKYPDTIRIILTGYTNEELLMDAISTGRVHSYVTKPWEPEELRVVVREGIETYEATRASRELYTRTLLRSGIISGEQLESALRIQKSEKKQIGDILLEYSMASQKQKMETLEKALKDPDEGVRQKAAEALSRIEAKVDLDIYIRMLDSNDRATKMQAIHLLAELAAETTVELLRIQMSDPRDDVRAAVIQALGNNSDNYRTREMREKAVDIALMGLEDANPSVRASAADALAEFGDPRCANALLAIITKSTEAVADEDEDVQPVVSALLALGEIGDRKVVPEVVEKAKADDLEVKEAALRVLGTFGDPRGESCLIEALASDSARIRMQAAESLGKI